ncbi:MAG: hypothetical protein ACXADF_18195 [Candidatus Thorarchaeota archaeon]|jgi:hypothetical protein
MSKKPKAIKWSEKSLNDAQEWSTQIDVPVKEVNEWLTAEFRRHEDLYPDQDQDFYEQRARFLVKSQKVDPILKNPSKPVNIIYLGRGNCRDIWARRKSDAMKLFDKDAEAALKSYKVGWLKDENDEPVLNAQGERVPVPLDTIEVFRNGNDNPGFRKPLPVTLRRFHIGIGYPTFSKHVDMVKEADQSVLKLVVINAGKHFFNEEGVEVVNNPRDWLPPLLVPAQTFLNTTRPLKKCLLDPDRYIYNDAAKHRTKVLEGTEFSENINFEDPNLFFDILTNLPSTFHAEIDEVGTWLEANSDSQGRPDYNKPVIVQGWVSDITHRPREGNSPSMLIRDMITEEEIMVWLNEDNYDMARTIGRGTNVAVTGFPSKREDEETGQDVYSLNAYGVCINYREFYSIEEDPVEQERIREEQEIAEAAKGETVKEAVETAETEAPPTEE